MTISAFDIFKIGIGPSSSHTVGPMKAARSFAMEMLAHPVSAARVVCELYGSLGATGRGHGTDAAVILGLQGELPAAVDVDSIPLMLERVRSTNRLLIGGHQEIDFTEKRDLVLLGRKTLPLHTNGMLFTAYGGSGELLLTRCYYSIGGGFVVDMRSAEIGEPGADGKFLTFRTGEQLLDLTARHGQTVADVMCMHELQWRPAEETRAGLLRIWTAMQSCIERGVRQTGLLPGPFKVRRRAPDLFEALSNETGTDPFVMMDWVNLFALAVNEENAAGGRVVTAPTNGAAGIVPAVLMYYWRFIEHASEDGIVDFLLTAAAIGILYKENASISGAEVGCQGEVGVACSMAAGALCAVMGGTAEQVESAAEIGMEHHLGLTCDPVGGLVQIPCIERNALASVKAINAARLALRGNGTHHVSLDQVIKTMRETGADMKTKYKETSRGGLALNIIVC